MHFLEDVGVCLLVFGLILSHAEGLNINAAAYLVVKLLRGLPHTLHSETLGI
jgi:hypothetical protein